MQVSQRLPIVLVIGTFGFFVCTSASYAQQPEPLRLSAPPAHSEVHADFTQTQAQEQTQTAQGELLDVDGKANTLTIKTQKGEMTFSYNEQSKVTGAQKGVAGLATMTGSQVTVMYRKTGQTNLATSIDVKESTPPK